MFARFLEMRVKPQKRTELIRKMKKEALPILKQYNGFVEMIPLDVETDPTRVYAMSVWHDKTHAKRYEKESFARVRAIYEPFLTMPIRFSWTCEYQ